MHPLVVSAYASLLSFGEKLSSARKWIPRKVRRAIKAFLPLLILFGIGKIFFQHVYEQEIVFGATSYSLQLKENQALQALCEVDIDRAPSAFNISVKMFNKANHELLHFNLAGAAEKNGKATLFAWNEDTCTQSQQVLTLPQMKKNKKTGRSKIVIQMIIKNRKDDFLGYSMGAFITTSFAHPNSTIWRTALYWSPRTFLPRCKIVTQKVRSCISPRPKSHVTLFINR